MWSAASYDGGGEEEEVVEVVEEVGIVDDAAIKAQREAAEKLAAAREYAIGRDQFITAAVDPGNMPESSTVELFSNDVWYRDAVFPITTITVKPKDESFDFHFEFSADEVRIQGKKKNKRENVVVVEFTQICSI
jgi:hypothetical protein